MQKPEEGTFLSKDLEYLYFWDGPQKNFRLRAASDSVQTGLKPLPTILHKPLHILRLTSEKEAVILFLAIAC